MIVFQVSLNFDPGKKILKIRCQIYIFMKNKVFRSTVLQPFQFEPEQKRKKLNIFTLQLPIYY